MTTVRVISGIYGLHIGGRLCPKNKESEPFEVDDREAERLVSLGVAEIVSTEEDAVNVPVEEPEDTELDDLSSKSVKELREIAKERGITFKVGTTKEEMVDTLSDMPDLTAESPI
ncbi:MAG: hypothetical protein IKN17_05945 [Ruminococcus sp.]|nr:hypothetical protein [Ruminococcus sp.]